MKNDFKYYAVTGNPILHSRSPVIFNTLFKQCNLNNYYTRLSSLNVDEAISMFKRLNLSGMNVTSPYKSDIIPFLDRIDEHSRKIGAVNTIKSERNKLIGYNTDYIGVVNSFKNNGIELKNKKCIILGAGNAGRAAIYGLIKEGADTVVVNRTYDKAKQAALDFGCRAEKIANLKDIINNSDVLVSTIPNSEKYIKNKYLKTGLVFLNANYKDKKIYKIFEEASCIVISGEEWLFNQAIPAFKIFTGLRINKISGHLFTNFESVNSKKIIALTGFMGCGKTKFGRNLANKLSIPFYDTDRMIEEREGMPVSWIFKNKGENYFRELERKVLHEIDTVCKSIIACGGGLIIDDDNRKYLNEFAIKIFLNTSFETCVNRAGKGDRPLFTNINEALKIYHARFSSYFSLADLIVNNEDSIENALSAISTEINLINYQ